MANTFVLTDWVSMEPLRLLLNNLAVASIFNTSYNSEYTKEFPVGDTVRVKKPQRAAIREGLGYNPQATSTEYTTVVVDQIFGVDFEFDSIETALKTPRGRERFQKEYMEPYMAQIAQEIDSRAALFAYLNTNHVAGALGTNPTTVAACAGLARQRLIEMGCPPGEKLMIVPPAVTNTLTAALVSQFNPSADISRQNREGSLGRLQGFEVEESMSLWRHTAGVWQTPASVTVNLAGQSGSTLNINCTSGDTFKKGDVFNIAAVYEVNPMTRRSTGTLKEFVVTADYTATATTGTISIAPAIVGPGSVYQNVSALPGNTAVLTLFPGTTAPSTGPKAGIQGLAIHKDAFALVGVKLETPKAVEIASQSRDPETGISVRFVKAFDPIQSKMVHRFDVLLGFGKLHSDNCSVRIQCA